MKLVFSSFLVLVFCFTNSTCKKIWKYPISMYGVWTCDNPECSWMLLEIKKNGMGNYGPAEACGKGANARGPVKYSDKALYIGAAKFKFISKPEVSTSNDSIRLSYKHRKQLILAKMTIAESVLRGDKTYTFYKIENY